MAVDTQAVNHFDYEWARAYMARMKADPTWPRRTEDEAGEE